MVFYLYRYIFYKGVESYGRKFGRCFGKKAGKPS